MLSSLRVGALVSQSMTWSVVRWADAHEKRRRIRSTVCDAKGNKELSESGCCRVGKMARGELRGKDGNRCGVAAAGDGSGEERAHSRNDITQGMSARSFHLPPVPLDAMVMNPGAVSGSHRAPCQDRATRRDMSQITGAGHHLNAVFLRQ